MINIEYIKKTKYGNMIMTFEDGIEDRDGWTRYILDKQHLNDIYIYKNYGRNKITLSISRISKNSFYGNVILQYTQRLPKMRHGITDTSENKISARLKKRIDFYWKAYNKKW